MIGDGAHLFRGWGYEPVHFDCKCPRQPCGATTMATWLPGCVYHHPTKTLRGMHAPEDCPRKEVAA